MTTRAWAARRLAAAIPVVAGITTLTFLLIHLAPGDPVYLLAGDGGSPAYYDDMREKFGLDRPILEQFARYLRTALLLDLGYSFTYDAPVTTVLADHLGASILLGATATLLALFGGIALAMASVFWPSRPLDAVLRGVAAVMNAAPVYWTGQMLIIFVAVRWELMPVGGMTSARHTFTGAAWVLDVARHLVLPAIALSLPFMAVIARVTTAGLVDALGEPFVQSASARGMGRRRIIVRHAAPHAAVAVVTLVGQHLPHIVGGAAITEYLFGWPGVGSVILHASLHRDYPLVTAAFLLTSTAVVVSNAIADALAAWVDPRIRLA